MPSTSLKHLAKRAKVTVDAAEKKWEHAKRIVRSEYDIEEDDPSFWALTTAVTKKMLGLKEEKMNFKQYLQETHYGSLVDPDTYNRIDKHEKALYKYTADGHTHLGPETVAKLAKRYPYEGGTIYRGLHFDNQEQHDDFLEKIKDGRLESNYFSSWTPHEGTAEDFAHSKKTYFPTMSIMMAHDRMNKEGEHMSGYGGVVISTTVGPNIGVDVSKTDFAKESEVILPAGTYSVKIVKMLEPYKRKYNSIEKIREYLKELKKAKGRDKEHDKMMTFLVNSWLSKMSEEDADIMMRYELEKFLKMPKDELKEKYSSFEINPSWKETHRLRFSVYVPVDHRIFDKCSDNLKKSILKQINYIAQGAEEKIKQVANHPDIDKVDEFDVDGMAALTHFLPSAKNITQPLRQILGKRYHQLNSRDVSRTLTDVWDIRKHGEKVANIINALTKL